MTTSQKQAARKFVEYWTFQRGSEKGEDQQFWNSLLRDVLGITDVEQHIKYQVPVQLKNTTKFLDAWIPETRVLIEHKSRGVNLDAPQTSALTYDADGNMTNDGTFVYAYDAENRLVSVTSAMETNGAIRVLNTYDHRNRRIRKTVQRLNSTIAPPPSPPVGVHEWETQETHTFVWDGNNIVFEKVEFANGTIRTFEYFWGADKSGSEQGAGGVEGLLAVSVDGVFYIPCYDHNGNIIASSSRMVRKATPTASGRARSSWR